MFIKVIRHGGGLERMFECDDYERFTIAKEEPTAVREDCIYCFMPANSSNTELPSQWFPEQLWLNSHDAMGFRQILLRGASVFVMSERGDTIDSWQVYDPDEQELPSLAAKLVKAEYGT